MLYLLKYYCADIHLLEETALDEWLEKVNEQRRNKVLRCKKRADRLRSLMAGILLRQALEREGIEYEKVDFSITSDGKTILYIQPELYFSISHSEHYVGVILSDRPVGLDIEFSQKRFFKDGRDANLDSLAKKCLASVEWERFSILTVEEKKRQFLEYWTKKESFSKAIGKGMKMNFSSIDTETNKKDYWSVWTTDGYCISIYVEGGNYQELQIEKLKSL